MLAVTAIGQVPGIMHYQGRVVVNGTNFNGTGIFKFALVNAAGNVTYWSNNGTSVGGSEPTAASSVPVNNGLYSVQLGSNTLGNMIPIPISVFNNPDVHLRVWFNAGRTGFQLLTPDQRIGSVGYAMISAGVPDGAITTNNLATGAVTSGKIADGNVSTADIADGTIISSKLAFGAVGTGQIATGAIETSKILDGSIGAADLGTSAVTNAKIADGAVTAAKLASNLAFDSPSVSGALSFGATARQMINLWSSGTDNYALGVQSGTLYQRSGSDFAWFRDGVHSNNAFDPGTGGFLAMRLHGDGELHVGGGAAGFSLQNRQTTSFVAAPASGERWVSYVKDGLYRIWSGSDKLTLDVNGKITASSLNLSSSVALVAAGTARGIEASSTSVGIGVRAINGAGGGAQSSTAVYAESTQSNGSGVVAVANNGTEAVAVAGRSTSGWAGVFEGKVKVGVLTITGGADLAEPFPVHSPNENNEIEPGTVLVIDEANQGHLQVSSRRYDKRVAGVVSGAGGVKPGLTLLQEDVMEGSHNVALTGRVYVKACSEGGPIRPGDLLTTADLPGHARRVDDHDRAAGAVLGKAMTRLERGTGLVLVLVTLQ